MTKNLSNRAKPSQKDKIQHQGTFYPFYQAALLFRAYLFVDANSQFHFPMQTLILRLGYLWVSTTVYGTLVPPQ